VVATPNPSTTMDGLRLASERLPVAPPRLRGNLQRWGGAENASVPSPWLRAIERRTIDTRTDGARRPRGSLPLIAQK